MSIVSMYVNCVRSSNLLNIERLLLIAERYVVTVEELYTAPRTIQAHGASFQGPQITLNIASDSPKMEFEIQASLNRVTPDGDVINCAIGSFSSVVGTSVYISNSLLGSLFKSTIPHSVQVPSGVW